MRSAAILVIFCVAIFSCSPANETVRHRSSKSSRDQGDVFHAPPHGSAAVGSAPTECGGGKLYRVATGSAVVAPTVLRHQHPDRPASPVPDPYGIGVVIVEAIITKDGQVCTPTLWRGT